MSMTRIGRIASPADGDQLSFAIDPGTETLLIENQLSAVLRCAYGRRATADDWDFVVPGSALFQLPMLGGESTLNVTVHYSGAIPADDVQAIIWATSCRWPAFVGPLA